MINGRDVYYKSAGVKHGYVNGLADTYSCPYYLLDKLPEEICKNATEAKQLRRGYNTQFMIICPDKGELVTEYIDGTKGYSPRWSNVIATRLAMWVDISKITE